MSLKLAKNNAPTYNYLSEGDGSNPGSCSVTLDNSGGTLDSSSLTLYLIATEYNYTDISLSFVNEASGRDWKISLDGSAWGETVSPADMDARSADQNVPIYFKCVVDNDGTQDTGNYTEADIKITYTESA